MPEIEILKKKLEEREKELRLLYNMIRKMSYSMDWQEIQQSTLDLIIETFEKVKFCLIGIFLENENLCVLRMKWRDLNTSKTDKIIFSFKFTEGIGWDKVVASNEWGDYFRKLGRNSEFQSSFYPLLTKERDIGIIMVDKQKDNDSSHSEYNLISVVTSHAAISINNSYLYQLAITDGLTNLHTRRYFLQRFEREISRSKRLNYNFSILMMDIDYFKRINDDYGHLSGDSVLKDISHIISENVKEYGISARYGGEEFICLLTEKDKESAFKIAEDIRRKIECNSFLLDSNNKMSNLTISIGIVTYPTDGTTIQTLIENADKSLYAAKESGRNKVVSFGKE